MLIIDGKKIVPAPFVTLSKTYSKTGDGRRLLPSFSINLAGTLLPGRGSPFSNGTFHTTSGDPTDESITTSDTKFNSLLRKQDALRELFVNPGILLEYGPNDGSPAVLARVKLENINFQPGTWVDLCNYSIDLSAEEVNKQSSSAEDSLGEFDDKYLSQASDSIAITQNNDGTETYSITHTVSAVGIASYDNTSVLANSQEPWENAKDWVLTRLDDDITTYLIDTTSQTRYNKVYQENIDKLAGSYSVVVTYTIQASDNTYSHTYSVQRSSVRSQTDDKSTGQLVSDTITISGTVTGFDENNDPATKLTNAYTAYNNTILPAIPNILGINTDHLYATRNLGEDYTTGTLTYSIVYNTNPNGETYTHNYSVNMSYNGGSPSAANISGSIQAMIIDGDVAGAFTTASTAWTTIKTSLRGYIHGIIDETVVSEPSSLQVGFDRPNLRITYTATYNCVDADNPSSATYFDQYEVSVNDANTTMSGSLRNLATASISGTIVGNSSSGSSTERYANALARWDAIKGSLNTRIEDLIGGTVPDRVLSKTYAYNRITGTISYSYTFAIRTDISNASIISEDVNVELSDPRDVFAVQIIPGLSTGPVLQNLGTVTEATTTLSASFVLANGAATGIADTRFDELVTLYQPSAPRFITNKTRQYNPYTGAYSVTRSWTHKGT